MNIKSKSRALIAGLLACAAGVVTAHASTLVTFSVDMGTNILNGTFTPGVDTISASGTFNSWGQLSLIQEGSSTIYTNTANDTSDADGAVLSYKFVNNHAGLPNGGYEDTADYNNRAAVLPSAGGSLVLPTPFFGDSGAAIIQNITFQVDMSQQINLGAFTNGSSTLDVRGNFNGWAGATSILTNDPSISVTNQYGLITSNVYTGTFSASASPNAAMDYKYVQNDNYEANPILADGGGNRFFTLLNIDQTNPIVYFSDAAYSPVAQVTFSVDMSIVALTDTNFNPASVTINGDLMGWGGVAMTNDPSASNTNLYTSPTFAAGVGSTINYQFRYTQLSDGTTVYDHANGANGGGGNHMFDVPNVSSTNVFSVFNDASFDDYLLQPTPVFFSVDMSWATTNDLFYGTNNLGPFNPSTDGLYINGQFANWYEWQGGFPPPPAASAAYQMHEVGLTLIYTNTIVMPAGTPVSFQYKYGTDPYSSYSGPVDDEAGFGSNHYRVVRSSAMNPYAMPMDQFHVNMYSEPFFSSSDTAGGKLNVGPAAGGLVPVTWLGRPGAELQVNSDLTGGIWQTLVETDGTNWTSGYSSTNGFVSQTNWPAADKAFFRLIKL